MKNQEIQSYSKEDIFNILEESKEQVKMAVMVVNIKSGLLLTDPKKATEWKELIDSVLEDVINLIKAKISKLDNKETNCEDITKEINKEITSNKKINEFIDDLIKGIIS